MNTISQTKSRRIALASSKRLLFLFLFLFSSCLFSSLSSWIGSGGELLAQDSRNRVTSTIIADGLAQLPAPNLQTLEQVMSEIAGTGAEGVEALAALLSPSGQGKNAPFEYAIDGLTSYVTVKGREAQCAAVKKGLEAAIAKCTDEGNKTFLQTQLQKLTPGSVEVKHPVEDLKAIAPNARAIAEFYDKVNATADKKKSALLLKALKGQDRQLRNTALEMGAALPTAESGKSFADLVCNAAPKLKADAQTDVIRWLGNHHLGEKADATGAAAKAFILQSFGSKDPQMVAAAIEAAGKVGGSDMLGAIIGQLDGENAEAAKAALNTFNGDIKEGVLTTLKSKGGNASIPLVQLTGERHMTEAYDLLVQRLGNQKLHTAVATSLMQIVSPDKVNNLLARFQPYPDLLFSLMAQRANPEDIRQIVSASNGTAKDVSPAAIKAAQQALLKADKPEFVEPLLSIAKDDAASRDAMLNRALALTKKAGWPSIQNYQLFKRALDMKPSAGVVNSYLTALGTLNNEPALNLAAQYMDVKENDLAAAHAVADLIEKNEPFQRGTHVREMLVKAQNVFRSHTEDADAGYAVDQVNTILPKIVDDPKAATAKVTKLSQEEKKAGFELLFDGTNLDKWTGNKTDYVPIDGAIYVSAHYGAEGNLYTTKKYSDFVFRFEFCFVRPGINNGVGIRTREGVDAAYEGMEIQILDHDDPIYKGLRDYQQHGSVYGIIVPEHVKFGPLGTWNTEEIRAVGDRITVTVNGKVILDGDIRKACQGHNMAPEEGKPNPYTVDHQSHPGLFNKDGLICFCGHGEGLKLRNIRVLDLSKQKKR
ncbi:MAG: DUF1080 domain-containing protein [Bacteroidaceae bacterium]|nr:DUF1080 domain-containing protein [Bacteroidaceae bacterium]